MQAGCWLLGKMKTDLYEGSTLNVKLHFFLLSGLSLSLKDLTMKLLAPIWQSVILVGHSLGGLATSYAMEQNSDKIIKAVFLAALMPPIVPVTGICGLCSAPPTVSDMCSISAVSSIPHKKCLLPLA
jgi:hypothetical protein